MYLYYQKVGGDEKWTPIQANRPEDLASEKPTFVTVLTLDTLVSNEPSREELEKIRYLGPMYFDLDSKHLDESIEGAKELLAKLTNKDHGLRDKDLEIYLSGKKGFHFIISPLCFMEKQVPVAKLPAIYKEMAFKLAVDTVDFAVYTARKGRMLRTCYNIRENGNYRVPISAEELKDLTEERYQELCKSQRTLEIPAKTFNPKFALVFEEAKQKIDNLKPKKIKPVDQITLKQHAPIAQRVLSGINLKPAGFNKIAIQIALYARECGMTEDEFIAAAQGLIDNHSGDGDRYRTPHLREVELRRMFFYVSDNPAYDYSIDMLKAIVAKDKAEAIGEDGEIVETEIFSCGVQQFGNAYLVSRGDAGDMAITNFVFSEVTKLLMPDDGTITGLTAQLKGNVTGLVKMLPITFAGSSGVNAAVMPYGGSFTGTDNHARGIYQIMLRSSEENRYLVDSEGINLVELPMHSNEELRKPFIVWADVSGVRMPKWAWEAGARFEFQGYPTPEGVMKTDLSAAPKLEQWLAKPGNKEELIEMLNGLLFCQTPDVIGKMVGWLTASFWRQIFHALHGKFPLLHIYGVAGAGKSEMTEAMMRLFYYKKRPTSVTPSGTPYAFLNMVSSSASIPVLLDEYKPATMNREILEKYRGIFRDAYNMKDVQRGGGNRNKDAYNALSRMELSAPIIFLAEAVETETAIMERMVLVTIKRPSPLVAARSYEVFQRFNSRKEILAILGHSIAARISKNATLENVEEDFSKVYRWAMDTHMLRPGDSELLGKGEMTEEEFTRRAGNKQRNVYNNSVAMFGLLKFKGLIKQVLPEEFQGLYGDVFTRLEAGVFQGMDVMIRSTVPEYVKVLNAMSDMTRLDENSAYRLVDNFEYNLAEIGGKSVLVIVPRAVFGKYQAYTKYKGSLPLYANDGSFSQALFDIPQYIGKGHGTSRMNVETLVLDMEALVKAGVTPWTGKAANLKVF